ncbi:MAG: hypothetical protein R2759_17945 [Bacteroidales bacterium]
MDTVNFRDSPKKLRYGNRKGGVQFSMPEENQVRWLKNMPRMNERERRDGKIITCTWEINRLRSFQTRIHATVYERCASVVLVAPL